MAAVELAKKGAVFHDLAAGDRVRRHQAGNRATEERFKHLNAANGVWWLGVGVTVELRFEW